MLKGWFLFRKCPSQNTRGNKWIKQVQFVNTNMHTQTYQLLSYTQPHAPLEWGDLFSAFKCMIGFSVHFNISIGAWAILNCEISMGHISISPCSFFIARQFLGCTCIITREIFIYNLKLVQHTIPPNFTPTSKTVLSKWSTHVFH